MPTQKFAGNPFTVKWSTVLIFALFHASLACAASPNEVLFTCTYELGAETDVQRTKVGSIAIAIDVNAKTARIDFGKGWDRMIAIQVDGTEVKETAPPNGGEDGFFHFDLRDKSGGFAGGLGRQEFFDGCAPRDSSDGVLAGEPHGGTELNPPSTAGATATPDQKKEATEAPPTATEQPAPPPTDGHGTTEYYGGSESPTKPAWTAEATTNPDYKKEAAGTRSTAAAPKELVLVPTGGHGTIEYYGGSESPTKPAWAAEAMTNPDYLTAKSSSATPTSPAASPVRDAAFEACRDAFSNEAGAATLYFANASFDIEPSSYAGLRKIAKIIKDCGNIVIEIGGHTDDTGDPTSNQTLSQLRAKSVVDFLIREGVDAAKLKAIGYGQERPVAPNETLEGRRLNRRIEFLVKRASNWRRRTRRKVKAASD
jgi:outer membrane protein OmpA-like peptidoglycan-associated protein